MKPFTVIKPPKVFRLLANETRWKVFCVLLEKEMTISQMSIHSGVTPQAIYHHIRKLVKGRIVKVVREERVGYLIKRHYRTNAEDFVLTVGNFT